jgi:hypothetical protein
VSISLLTHKPAEPPERAERSKGRLAVFYSFVFFVIVDERANRVRWSSLKGNYLVKEKVRER